MSIRRILILIILVVFFKNFAYEYAEQYFLIKITYLEILFLNKLFQFYIYCIYRATVFKSWFHFYLLYQTYLIWFLLPLYSIIFIFVNYILYIRSKSESQNQLYIRKKFLTFFKIVLVNLVCTVFLILYKYHYHYYIDFYTLKFWACNSGLLLIYSYELILHSNKTKYQEKNNCLILLIFISILSNNAVSFFYLY